MNIKRNLMTALLLFALLLMVGIVVSIAQAYQGNQQSLFAPFISKERAYNAPIPTASPTATSTVTPAVTATPNNISIHQVKPESGSLVGAELQVVVGVSSQYEIESVTAQVEGRQTMLSFSQQIPCGNDLCHGWIGILSLEGLARGEKTVTVIAMDARDDAASRSWPFIYDEAARLSVQAPLTDTVARPELFAQATCTDDDPAGCTELIVRLQSMSPEGGPIFASGQSTISESISLAQFDGRYISLEFAAQDSVGQMSRDVRGVYVESSAALQESATFDGRIIDTQLNRIFYIEEAGGTTVAKILNSDTGVETMVFSSAEEVPAYGFLTPRGAIFVTERRDAAWMSELYEWREDELVDLNLDYYVGKLEVAGSHAAWTDGEALLWRNLDSGISAMITNTAQADFGLAPDGDVVYSGLGYQIYSYRNGVSIPLTNDNSFHYSGPQTDGNKVVYSRQPCCAEQPTYTLVMYEDDIETILAPAQSERFRPEQDYQVKDGWIAYIKIGSSGVPQVWTRDPSDEETQISYFGSPSEIETLGTEGELTFVNFTQNLRYLDTPQAEPVQISSTLGRSLQQAGSWFVIMGRTLFQVEP